MDSRFMLHGDSNQALVPVSGQTFANEIMSFLQDQWWFRIATFVLGLIVSPALVASIISALGFGVAGIIAGTPAAAIVASYGGAVTAGSLCAILQSMGAAGLGIIGTVITGISGGAAATMTLDAIAGEEVKRRQRN